MPTVETVYEIVVCEICFFYATKTGGSDGDMPKGWITIVVENQWDDQGDLDAHICPCCSTKIAAARKENLKQNKEA